WGRRGAELGRRIGDAPRVADALQEVVRQRLTAAEPPDRVVRRTVVSLRRQHARRVEELADELGLSERQLHRRCQAALGYGPKTFAGIVRFQRFLEEARPGASLAALARRHGYADQAHLTREVHRLAGIPPGRLLEELS